MRRLRSGCAVVLTALGVVALDAGVAHAYVYWTVNGGPGGTASGTTLGRVNNDGSGPTHAFLSGAGGPNGIALDAQHVYWTNSGGAQSNSIGRANLDGSGSMPTWIRPAAESGRIPYALALDGSHIYWSDANRYVGRADIDGKNPDSHFVDAGAGNGLSGIAIAGSTLYIAKLGGIYTVPASGNTAPTLLVPLSGSTITTGLAVAGGYVYWSAVDNGSQACKPDCGEIGRATINGGSPDEKFVPGLGFPSSVATDGSELYWTDPTRSQIGRARLGSTGASDVQLSFVSEPSSPGGVAVNGLIDPTRTAVACKPAYVPKGSVTSCRVTVSDSASSAPPTGSVNFSSPGSTFFSGAPCTLSSPPMGPASCVVGAVPVENGKQTIRATYLGDAVHQPSTATTSFNQPMCVVPKLKGTTLATARKRLKHALCRLGKVTKPRHPHSGLVVTRQNPSAGKRLPVNTRVKLKLGAKHQ